jgi:hypothetical protein
VNIIIINRHGGTGFGSSLFNAVIGSSWMSSAPNGPPNHGPAHGSSYGTGRNSLRPRSRSYSHHSQMDHSSHRGDYREDVHIGMDQDIRKLSLNDYNNDRNTYGGNIVGLSVLSTELQLQSIKRYDLYVYVLWKYVHTSLYTYICIMMIYVYTCIRNYMHV